MSTHPTIDALTKAIQAIPTGARWDPGRALTLFAHAAVLGTTQRAQQGYRFLLHAKSYPPMREALEGLLFPEAQAMAIRHATSAYMDAVDAASPFEDVLTQVHAHFLGRNGGNGLGQHFTPPDMTKLVAALGADHRKRHPTGRDLCRVYEPCCGAGGLVLAQIQVLVEEGKAITVHATDLDPLCSAMTALQLLANQMVHGVALRECVVTVGDVLTGRERLAFASAAVRGWQAPNAVDGSWKQAEKTHLHV
ncbi:N-6 DNA methylase [Luteimonas dalianensis]|uniref:N-6 DNA methylase n=1 Tax=Luteimonas dalianensis TaxID=1148196 RepID=UPI003BEFB18E